MNRKKIVAGNWKMNLNVEESLDLIHSLNQGIEGNEIPEVLIAPTYLSLYPVVHRLKEWNSPIRVAAQNVHYEKDGAFTGEVSVSMLKSLSLPYCIVGHSERRTLFFENDESIHRKILKLIEAEIIPILCVGETLAEREAGRWQEVIIRQCQAALQSLSPQQAGSVVIAYEPVWAIGTGVSATPQQAQEVHSFIRKNLQGLVSQPETMTLLYGGSVHDKNAQELFSQNDIDGGLIGGASLKPDIFITIIHSLKK